MIPLTQYYLFIPTECALEQIMYQEKQTLRENSQMSLICVACNASLAPKKTVFEYMDMSFTHELLCCPICGMVFIPEHLAEGKIAEVERTIEDK